jgi:hypothetical protein
MAMALPKFYLISQHHKHWRPEMRKINVLNIVRRYLKGSLGAQHSGSGIKALVGSFCDTNSYC